jgi:hypothetical protein
LVSDIEEAGPPDKDNVKAIFGRQWTARDVYRVHHESELKRRTTEKYGHLPGASLFVGRYQQLLSDDFKQLEANDADKLKALMDEAEEWNRERPPKEQQRR